MNVTIVSAFRQATHYIARYFAQIEGLAAELEWLGHRLHLVLGYGDSQDGTGEALFEAASHSIGAILLDVSHGGKHYGSVVHPVRFAQLATVGQRLFDAIPADSQIVILIESDLIWDPLMICNLIGLLTCHADCVAVAPMILHQSDPGLYRGPGPFFYDTYAFRADGQNFKNQPPYHPILARKQLPEMESVGSVVAMWAEGARRVKWSEENVIVGICEQLRASGGYILCDSSLTVYHP